MTAALWPILIPAAVLVGAVVGDAAGWLTRPQPLRPIREPGWAIAEARRRRADLPDPVRVLGTLPARPGRAPCPHNFHATARQATECWDTRRRPADDTVRLYPTRRTWGPWPDPPDNQPELRLAALRLLDAA